MAKNTAKKVAVGAAIAAGVGYLAGILTAPKSGKQTRKDIKDTADKGVAEVEAQLKKLHAELDDLIKDAKTKGSGLNDKAKQELNTLVADARVAKTKAGGIIDGLRNNESADKDVKKAVAEASKALDHLKKYLKK